MGYRPNFLPPVLSQSSSECYSDESSIKNGRKPYCEKIFMVKIVLRERESVQEAVRRFRKLVERTGLKRELRRRERYEKPSDIRRRAKERAIRRSRKLTQSQ